MWPMLSWFFFDDDADADGGVPAFSFTQLNSTLDLPSNARLLSDGTVRRLSDGTIRLLTV